MKKNRTITETCLYCKEPYVPTRRGVQKYCSNACRSTSWKLRNKKTVKKGNKDKPMSASYIETKIDKNDTTKIEAVSGAGVANSFLGALAANVTAGATKSVFQNEENKNATKKDIELLKQLLNTRYFPVINIKSDPMQRKAFYDKQTGEIVFWNEQMKRFELPMVDL